MDNFTPLDDESGWIRFEDPGPSCSTWASACWIDGRYGVCLDTTADPAASVAILVFIPEDDFAKFRKQWQSAPAHFREVFEGAASRLPSFKMRVSGLKGAN